ncbi:hypothetical protein Q31a_63240 [Aureliella helgolandensis]|uniref:Lipoprotein n=1 Tax=Aureliella helgolandensis TaxID=2527968 RepID=A0A518GH61_9BACT|nr:hypothetical protein Q31a_63240 [Aureliella helgolandensis]
MKAIATLALLLTALLFSATLVGCATQEISTEGRRVSPLSTWQDQQQPNFFR